jgi:hypothetical protein
MQPSHKKIAAIMPLLLALCMTLFAQTGPGGIGGHENDIEAGSPVHALWLRANDLNYADGDFVTRWPDASGYNHAAVPGLEGKQGIIFQRDRINGHPWVRFQGINYLRIANHEVLDGGEGFGIFVVVKRDSLLADTYNCNSTNCAPTSNLVTKRAHWNAWSHVTGIPMDAGGLQHAYELRWEQVRAADEAFHIDTMAITAYMNGNLPDGAGADVFASIRDSKEIEAPYLISYCYSNHEESYGSFVRINAMQSNRPGRNEGNPNPIRVGPVVQSSKDLWLGGAQYDPPGAFGAGDDRETCPTCTETGLLQGAIAEVILFKGTLWHTHVFIIENYLSLKYGLPIDTVKYYHDDAFTHDMVGIGNEFGDDKKHRMSTSHALTIEEMNESLNAPRNYLFAAHDGEPTDWVTEGLENYSGTQRWGRTWKVKKMGDVDIRMSFNFITAELNLSTSSANVARHRLAYRENPEDPFTILPEPAPTRQLRTLHFEVPNELIKDGYYTVVFGYEEGTNVHLPDEIANSLEVFPSPASDLLTIRFHDDHIGSLTMRLVDIAGREVMTVTDQKVDAFYEHTLDVSRLQNGIFFLEFTINGHQAVKRVIKQ